MSNPHDRIAGLSVPKAIALAQRFGVPVKQLERWAGGARPAAWIRRELAHALDKPEKDLWPD